MANSITVGISDNDDSGKFRVSPSVKDVHASQGETSNQVRVEGRINRAPEEPEPSKGDPVGDTVETTHGTAKVHRTVDGKVLVTLPGRGLQVSLEEARRAGLIVKEQKETPEGKPNEKPKEQTKEAPKDPEEKADDLPTVTGEELQAHATELNAAGEAFEKAGLDAEDALFRAVDGLASGEGFPEDVEAALSGTFGEDAQTIVDNAYHHAKALTADAINAAGLSLSDEAAMRDLQDHLNTNPAVRGAYVAALKGQPKALNSIIADFASKRR